MEAPARPATTDPLASQGVAILSPDSERLFQALALHVPIGIFLTNASGDCLFVNPRWSEIAGIDLESALGDGWLRALHPEDRERVNRAWTAAARAGSEFAEEYRFQTPEGKVSWVSGRARAIPGADGAILNWLGTITDVTDRATATAELRRTAEELSLLHRAGSLLGRTLEPVQVYETARTMIGEVMDCDGLLLSSFDRDTQLIRCSYAWVDGRSVDPTQFPAVPLAPTGQGMQSQVIRSGEPLRVGDVDARIQHSPTPYRHVAADGTVHERSTEDDTRARSLVMVPIRLDDRVLGVLQVSSRRLDAYTPEHERMLEALTHQVAAASRNAVLYQEARTELAERVRAQQALEESERRYRELAQTLDARVSERTAEVEHGAEKLRDSNLQMLAFTYSISHDLRAPIRAMRGYADALLDDYGDRLDSVGQDFCRRIGAAASRMDRLIQDLLAYNRLSRDELQHSAVPLAMAVRDALAQIAPQVQETAARVRVDVAPSLWIAGHRTTLTQVIENLLGNALKFTAPGRPPRVRVRAQPRPDRVRLWVEDNGIGIAEEHQGKIFEMFHRLNAPDSYPGTGVGLALVHKALERMGGDVGVTSEPGRGSRFWIELRRAPAPAPGA